MRSRLGWSRSRWRSSGCNSVERGGRPHQCLEDGRLAGRWSLDGRPRTRTPPAGRRFDKRRLTVATFVLIHGAGDSSWYWHLVEPELRARGHDVVAPDLPCEDDSAGLWGVRGRRRRHDRRPSRARPRRAIVRRLRGAARLHACLGRAARAGRRTRPRAWRGAVRLVDEHALEPRAASGRMTLLPPSTTTSRRSWPAKR